MAFLSGFLIFPGEALAQQKHPLTGKLWSVREGEFIQPELLSQQLESGSWLFVGEQHDHPDHQHLATRWLKQLDGQGRLGRLALEMARQSQQKLLDVALGEKGDLEPESLAWGEGWPWERYAELVTEGLIRSQGVLGVDLDRQEQRLAYQEGAPRPAISKAQAAALDQLIDRGHCELLPREQLPQMRQVQLARDQAMAEVLVRSAFGEGVNLFVAGSVHVRLDLGVPRWLPSEVQVTSVLLQQVSEEKKAPPAYLPETVDGLEAFDFIFFTAALPPVDYCEGFRRARGG